MKKTKKLTKRGRRVRRQRRNTSSPLWRRKALQLWSIVVRAGRKCDMCGESADKVVLNAHHILPKERYQSFMFKPINGVCLCQDCHKTGRFSAHLNPLWFANWLKHYRPVKFKWAMINVVDVRQTPPPFDTACASLLNKAERLAVTKRDREFCRSVRKSLEGLKRDTV